MSVMRPEPFPRRHGLDADQSCALRAFVEDVGDVLAQANVRADYFERTLTGLAGAYYAALRGGEWAILIALVTDTLDAIGAASVALPAYGRLRALVAENLDLLPEEMLRLA
ncbi:MAG TPA: hypothetical protein VFA29_10195 [Candidatus Baltobacteraceae bacterium]|nr:hypothetical protein [Candidatus Baltobacteraceae bacterium]